MRQLSQKHDGFHRFSGRSGAALRLFCFPFAGGNALNFADLSRAMPSDIEVVAVDYPGRGKRFSEEPQHCIRQLVSELARSIRPYLDGPFAFYGHSNGALVAYELACLLPQLYFRTPEQLILGAKRCPALGPENAIHTLPDDAFVNCLKDYQGTPEQVLSCPDLMSVFLPIIRADFALSETYQLPKRAPLNVPTLAIAGQDDELATRDMMQAWKSLIGASFDLCTLDGGHFFLNSNCTALAKRITQALLPDIPDARLNSLVEGRTIPC